MNFKERKQLEENLLKNIYKNLKSDLEKIGKTSFNYEDFGAEIEAHADLFLNKTLYTEILKGARYLLKNGIKVNESFDKEYYNSLGMADMAKSDSGKSDKILMDFIWGLPTDKQVKKWKESKEEYKNGNGFTR